MKWRAPRAIRGGSWNDNAVNARSAYRNHNEPGNRNHNLGFRLCLSSIGQLRMRPPDGPARLRPSFRDGEPQGARCAGSGGRGCNVAKAHRCTDLLSSESPRQQHA